MTLVFVTTSRKSRYGVVGIRYNNNINSSNNTDNF